MEARYVLYNEEMGIYLGSCIGFGIWSKLDPAGQDAACTFESEAQAMKYAASWDSLVDGLTVKLVTPDRGTYISVQGCVTAGLPKWDPTT